VATYYVNKSGNDSNDGLSEENAKLTIGDAITDATANGTGAPHTINIGDGTYSETVSATGTSNLADATIQGASGDYSDVTIQGSATYQVSLGGGVKFKNITVVNDAAAAGSAKYAIYSSTGASTVTNCHLKSNNRGYYSVAAGSVIERCIIESTHKATTKATWGVWWSAANASKIFSCLILDWNHAIVYCYGGGDVVNCTAQTTHDKNTSLRGLYAANVYNSLCHNDGAAVRWGGITGTTDGENNVSWGWGSNDFRSNTSGADNSDSGDVSSDGEQFVDEDNDDFRLRPGTISTTRGSYSYQTNNSVALLDLVGRPYDTSTPSAGCYQYAWGASGGKKLAATDRDVIGKICGVSSTKVAKTMGQG